MSFPHPDTNVRYRDRLRASVLIGLCCLLVYNANLRAITAGDTYPARYLPFAILQYHTIFFDPILKVAAQGRGDGAYWLVQRPGRPSFSVYPIVVPVLIAPLYIPAVAYLHLRGGWTDARLDARRSSQRSPLRSSSCCCGVERRRRSRWSSHWRMPSAPQPGSLEARRCGSTGWPSFS